MTNGTPRAIAVFRHSPRTTCQRMPMPGVTFVRIPNVQAAGKPRMARTMEAARKTWMLPRRMSSITPGKAIIHGTRIQKRQPIEARVQPAAKTGHGSRVNGQSSCAKTGE